MKKKLTAIVTLVVFLFTLMPMTAMAENTGETYTLTIKYAVEDSNGVKIGTEIEDKVITGITPGTVIDLSDYWPDQMSVTDSNGTTCWFLNHSKYSDNRDSYSGKLFYWVADKNDVIYAHYEGWHAPYELTLDPNGGTVNCQKILSLQDPLIILSSDDQLVPVRDGYKFLGWSLDKNELSDQHVVVEDSGTLYAIWEELPSVQVGMTTLYDGEYTTDGQSTTTTKPESGGYAHFENGVLTLNNFTYSGSGENGAVIYSTSDLTINAVGTNTINSDEKYAIYLKGGNLTIEGDVLNLAVSDAEKAIATLTLYNNFNGTYGKLTITDMTLNIDNIGNDQTTGIRCGDVWIDGSTLNVTMDTVKQYTSIGLDAVGTVTIVHDSRVVIDLSKAENSNGMQTAGDISIADSYVELRGDINNGVGIAFNTIYKTLDFDGGTLIIAGARDPGGAAYMYNATIALPDGDYWWRTDENGTYSKGDYTYNKSQTYIELTTTDPHSHVWDDKYDSDSEYHWKNCTVDGCPISDNAQKEGYGSHNPGADDGDCSTAVTCTICKAVTTASGAHSFTERSTVLASEGDCQNPKTYYAKCANCDQISDTVTVASSEYGDHKWDTAWSFDGTKHWHKCLNSGCTVIKDEAAHSFGDDNICDVCSYAKVVTTNSTGGGFTGDYNYPVTVAPTEGAIVGLSEEYAVSGDVVTINVAPDDGKQVRNVIVTDKDGEIIPVTKAGDNQYTFTMPEGAVNISVTTKAADYTTKIVLQIGSRYVTVNSDTFLNDVAPMITDGRTMLPIRVIAEALGADVDWNAELQKVTITKGDTVIELFIGKYFAYVNGEVVKLDAAPFIDNGRTYLPVRFISEVLGCDVDWDAVTRTVTIWGNK